nr:glycosyltransferase family 2 protein [uncultured Carboxylicivirga sp.]
MKISEILFWILIGLVFYTYLGYGILIYIIVRIKRLYGKKKSFKIDNYEPEVTILVAAYNEKEYVERKVINTKSLDYPPEKLHQIWVTDGSNDGTPEFLQQYENVQVFHQAERRGKIAAINRAMKLISTPIVVFTDANTTINKEAIKNMVALFSNPKVGGIAGEKRIKSNSEDDAATAGESIYWKYESSLKKWDAELSTTVGAAGELFAIRSELFIEPEPDTLLDDFMIAMRINMKGYSIQYDPEIYAMEEASANVQEELKRKIRIAAGGIQSIFRLLPLFNIFIYGLLSFQYLSHRVLRWTITPIALLVLLGINILIYNNSIVYQYILWMQLVAYSLSFIGYLLDKFKIKLKIAFVPYYFVMMNYAVFKGFLRYIRNKQSVNWERAMRRPT